MSLKFRIVAGAFSVAAMLAPGAAKADNVEELYKVFREKALSGHKDAYARLNVGDTLGAFNERVELVDEVALLLARRMTSTKAEVLDELLTDILNSKQSVLTDDRPRVLATPADIYNEYVDLFRQGLPAPPLSAADVTVLKLYYSDAIQGASEFVLQRGKVAAAADPKAADEVAQLCAVLALMEVPETQWSKANVQALPEHVRNPESLRAMEELAVQIRRPMTACCFAEVAAGQTWDAARKYAYFVSSVAERRKRRQYLPAVSYLSAAIGLAEDNKDLKAATGAMYIELAELYEEMAHPKLAAQTLGEMMDKYPRDEQWGKSALLRLKYLYECNDLEALAGDGAKYVADARAKAYLLQIRYILWVTHRRLNHPDVAAKIQKDFVKSYPKSMLCADMYFASAMGALAEGDYTEAGRLLEVIEYRYPRSSIASKARQVQERLRGLEKG